MNLISTLTAIAVLGVGIGLFTIATSEEACAQSCVRTFCGRNGPSCAQGCSCQIGIDNITGFCG